MRALMFSCRHILSGVNGFSSNIPRQGFLSQKSKLLNKDTLTVSPGHSMNCLVQKGLKHSTDLTKMEFKCEKVIKHFVRRIISDLSLTC